MTATQFGHDVTTADAWLDDPSDEMERVLHVVRERCDVRELRIAAVL